MSDHDLTKLYNNACVKKEAIKLQQKPELRKEVILSQALRAIKREMSQASKESNKSVNKTATVNDIELSEFVDISDVQGVVTMIEEIPHSLSSDEAASRLNPDQPLPQISADDVDDICVDPIINNLLEDDFVLGEPPLSSSAFRNPPHLTADDDDEPPSPTRSSSTDDFLMFDLRPSPKRRYIDSSDESDSCPSPSPSRKDSTPLLNSPAKRRRTLFSSADSTQSSTSSSSLSNNTHELKCSLYAKSTAVLLPFKTVENSISQLNLGTPMNWQSTTTVVQSTELAESVKLNAKFSAVKNKNKV